MKIIIKLAVVVAAISLLLGIVSRVTGAFIGPLGLTPIPSLILPIRAC